jgi:hypothetical protein
MDLGDDSLPVDSFVSDRFIPPSVDLENQDADQEMDDEEAQRVSGLIE